MVSGFGKLQQGALHAFFLQAGNLDRLQGLRIKAGMVHGGRNRARCGIKILNLFRHDAVGLDVAGQFDGICQGCAWMP